MSIFSKVSSVTLLAVALQLATTGGVLAAKQPVFLETRVSGVADMLDASAPMTAVNLAHPLKQQVFSKSTTKVLAKLPGGVSRPKRMPTGSGTR